MQLRYCFIIIVLWQFGISHLYLFHYLLHPTSTLKVMLQSKGKFGQYSYSLFLSYLFLSSLLYSEIGS